MPDAEALCRRALALAPDDPAALRQLGLVLLVAGDAMGALALVAPLSEAAPGDLDLAIARAEAEWAVNAAAAAIPHLRRALALAPDRDDLRARLGLALLTSADPTAARDELTIAIASRPDDAAALTSLGMALAALGAWADAIGFLHRAMQADPLDPACAFQLGQALREAGRIDEAAAALREAVRCGPGQAHLHLALGDALFARRDYAQAADALRQAVALDPGMELAWAKLGDAERLTGASPAAATCYRRAVALAPDNPELHALLGNALTVAGDNAGGAAAFGRAMAASWRRPARAPRVGVLAAPDAANTPTDFIIDRTRFAADPLFVLEGFNYPHALLAQTYGVLFNAISDPDASPNALAQAGRLVARLGVPLINPPAAIAGTTRDRMAAILSGIDGLRVPETRRLLRTATPDFSGPVLVRSTGSHGGANVAVAQTVSDVKAMAAALPTAEIYLTQFVDVRARDGLYRKLRLVFVDGVIYPVHLAIGDHWLGHYFRTQMAANATLRAEEAAFLRDPQTYLGRIAWAALRAIQNRVRLDYFGIDGALDRDGELVLFECNAAMLVRHADRPAMFDYKRKPAELIRAAVGDMLDRVIHRPAAATRVAS